MLRGDATDHAGSSEVGAPQRFQRLDLTGELRQALVDQFGLAAGARGAERQAEQLRIEFGGIQGFAQQIHQAVITRLIGQPQLGLGVQALTVRRLQVRRQQHARAGAPGTEQGDRQLRGIIQVHGQAAHIASLQPTGQLQRLLLHLAERQRGGIGYLPRFA